MVRVFSFLQRLIFFVYVFLLCLTWDCDILYDRDNDLHRLLFMPNGLPDGTDLAYYSKGKVVCAECSSLYSLFVLNVYEC